MNIVYTAILGSCDSLKPAPVGADRAVCFTDDEAHFANPHGWSLQMWPERSWQAPNSRREAWRLRCIPHVMFPGCTSHDGDTVTWIDASFTLTDFPKLMQDAKGHDLSGLRHHKRSSCYEEGREIVRVGQGDEAEVSAQLHSYSKAGFKPTGLTISCVLVRSFGPKAISFNEAWQTEIEAHPGDNTQLSLDYAAWKAGLTVHHLSGFRKDNPYSVHDHADHKRRRRPYQ